MTLTSSDIAVNGYSTSATESLLTYSGTIKSYSVKLSVNEPVGELIGGEREKTFLNYSMPMNLFS